MKYYKFLLLFSDDCKIVLCEALGAISSLQPQALMSQLGEVLNLLTELSSTPEPTSQQTHTKVMLCTLVFQTLAGYKWNSETLKVLHNVISNNDLWANYRVIRAAIRYGHHKVAFEALGGLTERVSSEHLHFWLVCLKEMCEAEAQFSWENRYSNLVDQIDSAVVHYNKGIAALKVR